MRLRWVVAVAVAAASIATPAAAQVGGTVRRPAARPAPRGFRVYVRYDYEAMTASKTFDAVIGTSKLGGIGGGAEALGLWKGLFARAAFSSVTDKGTRVFVFDGKPVSLGIDLTIDMTPVEVAAGWRFRRVWRLVPYVGAGGLLLKYDETSQFAADGENTSQWFTGYVAFGGVEIGLWKWIVAGIEGEYRGVPNALGDAGVSAQYRERDLGGVVARVLVGLRK
jgi:opacity protein-like surface antigen